MPTFCTKIYSDIPFAHRQHKHDGHCAMIHGHNWTFEFNFAADKKDECDFIIDFGKLVWLRKWLLSFDHALVLNADDPSLGYLKETLCSSGALFADILVVPSCSCEGLAEYAFVAIDKIVRETTNGRVWLNYVRVTEDSKNSAYFQP